MLTKNFKLVWQTWILDHIVELQSEQFQRTQMQSREKDTKLAEINEWEKEENKSNRNGPKSPGYILSLYKLS